MRGGLLFLDDWHRGFRYAVRSLFRDLRFTSVAVFALALGIGASTVVFSVFYNLLFNALAAKDAQRVVVPLIEDAENPNSSSGLFIGWADLIYLKAHNQVFDGVIGYRWGRALVQQGPRVFQFADAMVTADAFDFYGVPAFLGRGISFEDGAPGAPKVFVLSYGTWKAEFGADPGIVGKSFVVDGQPRTLVGVMPRRFHGFGASQELFTPLNWSPSLDEAKIAKLNVRARLKRGVTLATGSAWFDILARRLAAMHLDDGDYPKKFTARLVGSTDYMMGASKVFNSKIGMKSILYDLLAAVLVLLLIACSNVTNLLLARATVREKELAVRSALGASRGQILRQLLMESLVLALSACVTGCAVAWGAMKVVDVAVHQKTWAEIGRDAAIGLNFPVLLFAAGITVLTTVFCGLIPALRVTRSDPQSRLVGSGKGTSGELRHGKLRASLVIGQIALSIVLLVGAGLMMRSLYKLTHIDLGFDPKNILVVALSPARTTDQLPDRALMSTGEGRARFARVLKKIKEVPGVASVAVNNVIPGYGPSNGPRVTVPGGMNVENAGLDECDENCEDTLRMRMIAGRWLSRDEVASRQYVAVLNEKLARDLFGGASPVGEQLEVKEFDRFRNGLQRAYRMNAEETPADARFQIVGVVADVKNAGPQQPSAPMAFIPPMIIGNFILQVRTYVKPRSIMHAIQEQVWAADRAQVFWTFDPLDEILEQYTYTTPEFGVTLSGPIAAIALLLVVVGVFSVMAYTVSLRTQEIGLRMAIGAQQREILAMMLHRGVALIAAGISIGLFASFALTRFLASQIWGTSPTDPWTFAAVLALVVAAGLSACYFPARRATRVDPLVALRYE